MPQRNTVQIIINATDNASQVFNSLADNAQTIGSGIVNAFAATAAAVGVATTAMVTKGIADFTAYERGINEVFTLLPGASAEAMHEIEGQVQRFSARFGTVTDEVIPAMYEALSAGVPQDNVFQFLEVAQKAAIGGATELATAVDGITSVINAYGTDVIDAATASDQMFRAVVLGKTTFEELSASMFNVLPVAASLGVGFADIQAAIAAVTSQGVPTSVATTQIRGALEELADSASDAGQAFTAVAGKSFRDFIAEGGNLSDAMVLIQRASEETGVPINELFSRVEAANAVLALTGSGAERFATFLDDVTASAGATDAAFDQMNQGIGRAMDRLAATFKNFSVNLGRLFAPMFEPLIRGFSDVVQILSGLLFGDFGMEAFSEFIGEVPDAFKPLLAILAPLAAGFRQLATDLDPSNTNGFFGALAAGMPLFEAMETMFRRVATAMGFAEPFVDMVGNIGSAVGALITNLSNGMGLFDSFAMFIGNVVATLTGNTELGATIVGVISGIGNAIEAVITPIMEFITANVELQDVFMAIGIVVASVVIPALWGIVTAAAPVIATFAAIVGAVALVRTAWEENWGGIQEKAGQVMTFISESVLPVLQQLADWFITDALPEAGRQAEIIFNDIIMPLWDWLADAIINTVLPALAMLYVWFVEDALPAIGDFISGTVQPIVQGFIDLLAAIWEMVSPPLTSLYNWFVENLPEMGENITAFIAEVWNNFTTSLGGIWDAIQAGILAFQNGVSAALETVTGWINDALEAWNNLKGAVSQGVSGWQQAGESGGQIISGLQSGQFSFGQVAGAFGREISGLFGSHQFGGDVQAGMPITVGHGGIETFVPRSDGEILSAAETAQRGGGAQPITINFYFQRGITDQEARDAAYKVKRELSAQGISVEGTF